MFFYSNLILIKSNHMIEDHHCQDLRDLFLNFTKFVFLKLDLRYSSVSN